MQRELFSPQEQKVISILGSRKMPITEITKKFFKGRKRPENGGIAVAAVVRRVAAKAKKKRLGWTIVAEGKGGRAGRVVHKEMSSTKKKGKKSVKSVQKRKAG